MPLTLQDMVLVFIRFMVFLYNDVGWSKLVFINTILRKPKLDNDYMIYDMILYYIILYYIILYYIILYYIILDDMI